jgi:hypothetical protein
MEGRTEGLHPSGPHHPCRGQSSSLGANPGGLHFTHKNLTQRPILNIAPGGEVVPYGQILFPGAGRSYPLGVKFSVCPSILLNIIEYSPMRMNKGVNIPPRGPMSPLGTVHPWGPRVKLRMTL